ncbi:PREDICTED: uncharacterized protein LOC108756370 [Trachymyrmex septentrionalis]|uniref:uncharacterized protein LOC108756370 n=1 Tax=Trachymyrmex septentrionalis TaxID=34720 RepID=UPI00084F3A7C|nr:PREDICTED: uncharacterized protein LOC108756370 [Trachymyrmex septentrionalis]
MTEIKGEAKKFAGEVKVVEEKVKVVEGKPGDEGGDGGRWSSAGRLCSRELPRNIDGEPASKTQEKNSCMESAETQPIIVDNVDAETVKPSTSKDTKQDMKSSEDSLRKKKLHLKLLKLQAQNKMLREIDDSV